MLIFTVFWLPTLFSHPEHKDPDDKVFPCNNSITKLNDNKSSICWKFINTINNARIIVEQSWHLTCDCIQLKIILPYNQIVFAIQTALITSSSVVKFFLLSSCIANFNEHMIVIFYRSLYKDSICWYHQFIIISTCITYNMTYLAPFDPCLTRLKFKSTAGPNVTVTSCVCGWKLLNRKKKLQYFQTNSMEDLKAKIYCKNY